MPTLHHRLLSRQHSPARIPRGVPHGPHPLCLARHAPESDPVTSLTIRAAERKITSRPLSQCNREGRRACLPAEKPQPRHQNLSGLAHVPATSYLARLVGRGQRNVGIPTWPWPRGRIKDQAVDETIKGWTDPLRMGRPWAQLAIHSPWARPMSVLPERDFGAAARGRAKRGDGDGDGGGEGGDIYTTSRGRTTHKVTGPRGKYLSRPTILPPPIPPGCRFPADTGCVPSETRPSPPHPPGPQSLSTSPQHMISETASAAAAMKKPLSASLGPAPPRPPPAPPPALLTPAWLRLRCERGLGRWS